MSSAAASAACPSTSSGSSGVSNSATPSSSSPRPSRSASCLEYSHCASSSSSTPSPKRSRKRATLGEVLVYAPAAEQLDRADALLDERGRVVEPLLDRSSARAGEVHGHAVGERAAQQSRDRLAVVPAADVPERDLRPCDRIEHEAAAVTAVAHRVDHVAVEDVALPRVAPEQHRREQLPDERRHRVSADRRLALAPALRPVAGADPHEHGLGRRRVERPVRRHARVAPLAALPGHACPARHARHRDGERLDLDDFHLVPQRRRRSWRSSASSISRSSSSAYADPARVEELRVDARRREAGDRVQLVDEHLAVARARTGRRGPCPRTRSRRTRCTASSCARCASSSDARRDDELHLAVVVLRP